MALEFAIANKSCHNPDSSEHGAMLGLSTGARNVKAGQWYPMQRRKLRIYSDADVEMAIEEFLQAHRWVKHFSAKKLGLQSREDGHHFREAIKRKAVLITHDRDYLSNTAYPIERTHGVIVVKRGHSCEAQTSAIDKFLDWMWLPHIRDTWSGPTLGPMKVHLSPSGFKYWGHNGNSVIDDYEEFRRRRTAGNRRNTSQYAERSALRLRHRWLNEEFGHLA